VEAQRVRVHITPNRAIAFDPDKAMGSSMDILSAKEIRHDLQRTDHQGVAFGRMGTDHVPAEYGTDD